MRSHLHAPPTHTCTHLPPPPLLVENAFWKERYCPRHQEDRTPQCCACTRYQPAGEGRGLGAMISRLVRAGGRGQWGIIMNKPAGGCRGRRQSLARIAVDKPAGGCRGRRQSLAGIAVDKPAGGGRGQGVIIRTCISPVTPRHLGSPRPGACGHTSPVTATLG